MGIHYIEKNQLFHIENSKISFILWIDPLKHVHQIYFGKRIDPDDIGEIFPQRGNVHTVEWQMPDQSICDPNLQPFAVHTLWSGDYGEPTLNLTFENGNRRLDLTYQSYEILNQKPQLPQLPSTRGGQALVLHLLAKGIAVHLTYSVFDDCSCVQSSVSIENKTKQAVILDRAFSFALHLPSGNWDTLTLPGYTRHERDIERNPLAHGSFSLDSRRGVSSAMMNPFLALLDRHTNENWGTVYGVNLIYSGSFRLIAQRMPNETVRVCGGIEDCDFSWKLEPNQAFTTPEAIMCFSCDGLNGFSHEMHTLYREHILPPHFAKAHHPIVMNNWEGTRFDCTKERIYPIIDAAAGRGIDTFVLDDGWFGKRDDTSSGLGDWFVNNDKIGGMKELIDYVHQKGMRFGLWFEPEMICRDSELFRSHPDWVMQTPDETPLLCRNQMVLDLLNPETRDYVVQSVNKVLTEYEIDYVKWDCNRDLTEGYSLTLAKDRQKEVPHRYVLGLYDLFERIVNANPKIYFEGCASGGNRFDGGMLYYFAQIWTSDNADPQGRQRIQYGTSVCYPLSSMACHVASSPNRNGAHFVPWQTRAAISQFGATGYEMDLAKASPAELANISVETEEYLSSEQMMLCGKAYRLLSPFEGNIFAMQMVSEDQKQSKLLAIQETFHHKEPLPRIYPKGLSFEVNYRVKELNTVRTGRTWMNYGIQLDFDLTDFACKVYHFIAEP